MLCHVEMGLSNIFQKHWRYVCQTGVWYLIFIYHMVSFFVLLLLHFILLPYLSTQKSGLIKSLKEWLLVNHLWILVYLHQTQLLRFSLLNIFDIFYSYIYWFLFIYLLSFFSHIKITGFYTFLHLWYLKYVNHFFSNTILIHFCPFLKNLRFALMFTFEHLNCNTHSNILAVDRTYDFCLTWAGLVSTAWSIL